MDKNFEKKIILFAKTIYDKCDISDNILNNYINSTSKSKELVSLHLKSISEHEIVITDRLHGMIFSAITRTSCIAIKNYNHKISSSYEWFKHFDYIKLLNNNNITEFLNLIYYFKNKKSLNVYNKKYFKKYYKKIREKIINLD